MLQLRDRADQSERPQRDEPNRKIPRAQLEAALERACQTLRESEERLALFTRAVHDAVWDWNRQTGEILPASLFRHFGYTQDEPLPTFDSWLEHIHPEDGPRVKWSLDQFLQSDGTCWWAEYRFRRSDGTYAIVFHRSYPSRDASGQARRMVGVMTDVTGQRRLETERRELDERFRLLVEGVNDYAIIMLDPDGKVVSWNPGAQKMTGYEDWEVVGHHFSIFYPKAEVANGKPRRIIQTVATEGRFEEEEWRVRKDRTQFWSHATITALRDEAGNLRGFASVTRDVTERRYAENVLRESEQRKRFIIECAHEAFVSIDAQGIILDWNRQAEMTFGWPREAVTGRSAAKTLLPMRYRKVLARGLGRYEASGKGLPLDQRFEILALHRDGRQFPVEATMTCLRLDRGHIFYAFLHDISERREAQEKLKQVSGEILRSQEAERRRVARELHDGVGQILSLARMSLQPVEDVSSQTRAESRAAVSQAATLVGQCIEEVRRIAQNLMPSELEDLGLMAAVRSLCASLRQRTKLKIKLTYFRVPTELSSDVKLALFRIIQEALNNAVKHAGASRIAVHIVQKHSHLRACVTDNGSGFESPRTPKGSRKTGMGIVSMRERVASIGAKFRLRTAPGHGTKIEVEVPIPGLPNRRKDAP